MKKTAKKARKVLDSLVKDGLLPFPSDLCGLCALGSWFLCKKLCERGFKAELYVANNNRHVWVQVGKTIIDITVSQFDKNREIYIGRKSIRNYYYDGYKATNIRKTFVDWDDFQSPLKRNNMKLLEERWNGL